MFLISDPMPIDEVDYFDVDLDGNITRSDAERDTEQGQARLHFELVDIGWGQHTAKVQAVNAWGDSGWSGPFTFAAALPSVPFGLGLSEN